MWFVAVNLGLIAVTYVATYYDHGGLYGYIMHIFKLNIEMNFGVWWSGMCLLCASLLSYELFCSEYEERETKFSWLVLAIVFLGLSIDEISSIHERIFDGWTLLLIVLFFGSLVIIPALWNLITNEKTQKSGLFITAGLFLMALAIPQEYIEHRINWPEHLLGIRVAIEEGSELFGSLIALIGLVNQRERPFWPNSISQVIPNPYKMTNVVVLLTIGVIVQVFVSFITTDALHVKREGNPAAFIPATAFFILMGKTFWKIYIEDQNRKFTLSLMAFLLLVGSAMSIYALSPGYYRINLLWATYGLLLFISTFALHSKYIWKKIIILTGIFITFMLANENPVIDYILPTLFALYIGAMIRSKYLLKHIPFFSKNG
jgi:hypothetical protein